MSSKSTKQVEKEKADRFSKARSSGYVVWTREQGEKIKQITNEKQSTEERDAIVAETENRESVEERFNS